jgi:hypothetical protein
MHIITILRYFRKVKSMINIKYIRCLLQEVECNVTLQEMIAIQMSRS